jgi:hypothetical protein
MLSATLSAALPIFAEPVAVAEAAAVAEPVAEAAAVAAAVAAMHGVPARVYRR